MSRSIYALLGAGLLLPFAGHLLFAAPGNHSPQSAPTRVVLIADSGTITRQGPLLNITGQGDVHLTSTQQTKTAVLTCQTMDASGTTAEDTALNAEGDVHWSIPMSEADPTGSVKEYLLTVHAAAQSQPMGSSSITLTCTHLTLYT